MLIKTRGIVFRSLKYSESSVIVDIYTEELGIQSYIVSGVRSKKATVNASLLQLMSLLDLVVYHKKGKDLNRTKEVKPALVYRSIPFDIVKSSIGLYMVELSRKTIKESESNLELFDFLFNCFSMLDDLEIGVRNFHLFFTVRLTAYLGFEPSRRLRLEDRYFDLKEGSFTSIKPPHFAYMENDLTDLMNLLQTNSFNEICALKLDRQLKHVFLEKMMLFYQFHIENLATINSPDVLRAVLND